MEKERAMLANVPAKCQGWGGAGIVLMSRHCLVNRGRVGGGTRYRATLACQQSYVPAKFRLGVEGRGVIYDWLHPGRTETRSGQDVFVI